MDYINPFFFNFFEEGTILRERERSGYGDTNFVLNSGSVYWFIVMYAIGVALIAPIFLFTKKLKERKFFAKMGGFLLFSFIISTLIEGYIEFLMGSLIQLDSYTRDSRAFTEIMTVSGERAGAISTIVLIVS